MLFLGLYITGTFDLIISRIMDGLAAGDLSTARNSSLETLMLKGIVDFKMMEGHEVHNMSKKMKEIYLKYYSAYEEKRDVDTK